MAHRKRKGFKGGSDPDNPSDQADDVITEPLKKKGGKKSPGGHRLITKLPACSLPTNMVPTFYVGGGNGVMIIEKALNQLGWKRITDKYDERFRLKWVECKSRINYGSFREGEQMVNHLPNSHLLTNKLGLLNSLKEYERVTLSTKGRLPRLKMSEFHPETYKLDEKTDRDLFLETYKDGELWICKPVGMNQGKGIFLLKSRESINQILEEREQRKQQTQKPGKPLMNRIVQRYLINPLLLDGRKFDVRAYMLVASTVPYLILYQKGYVRLTCHKYDANDITNLGVHLTNQFVQKKDPNYKELKESTAWSMDKFNNYVNEEIRAHSHVQFEEDWVYNTFTKQMQKIMIHCFNSVKHKLQARTGFFDLFGLDFMVDTDMKVWLIEINVNPCMSRNCAALKAVIPSVLRETVYVAIECFEKSRKHQPLMPLHSLKNFTILYCGTRPNTIIPRQSRSVSPIKDNTATEKTKFVPTGALKRSGSPPRPSHRVLTQSTPLYNATMSKDSRRISVDRNDALVASSSRSLTSTRNDGSGNIVTGGRTKTNTSVAHHSLPQGSTTAVSHRISALSHTSSANSSAKPIPASTANKTDTNKADVNKVSVDKVDTMEKSTSTVAETEKKDKEIKDQEMKESSCEDQEKLDDETEKHVKGIPTESLESSELDTVVQSVNNEAQPNVTTGDTLARTTDSLNLATSALGRISLTLNQAGIADSLLEEVRLKMTHSNSLHSLNKPPSAKSRERMERGN